MDIIITALSQSMLFFPLALGIYISYVILRATDLTVDGSFVLGAAIFGRLLSSGTPVGLAFLAAGAGGALAGIGVSLIQYKGRINSLLAGILALFMLYSINFDVMGRPNISLFNDVNLGSLIGIDSMNGNWLFVGIFVVIITILLGLLLISRYGLILRAFGDHQQLLHRLGHRIEFCRFAGFALSNALVAWCGAMTAEINGYADLNMGFGMALTGIGTVVIGRQILKPLYRHHRFHLPLEFSGCVIGVCLYFLAINEFLAWGVNPINLKLLLGIILVFFLRLTTNKRTLIRQEL
jgi:putative tryptophan/tyrosine transport system permease protein